TARTLGFLTPAIILQALTQILIRAFYALHNTKTPLKISFISLVINILSSYFFVHYTNLGIVGLAVSATIGNIIQSFGLFYLFIHTVDGFNYKIFFPKVIKIIFNSVFMALTTYGTLKILDLFILDTAKTVSVLILFIISLVVGFVSYYLFSRLFTPEELKPYHHLFQKYVSRLFISPK
ncbi:MAG: lipid II flippase MurJ, partial [Candidatus Shapirobacteria bacterium]